MDHPRQMIEIPRAEYMMLYRLYLAQHYEDPLPRLMVMDELTAHYEEQRQRVQQMLRELKGEGA